MPTAFFHVDIDSPATLARFWAQPENSESVSIFYERGMERALKFFREFSVSVTFFCVGKEIDRNGVAREKIRKAFEAGHEIANHSYSHFYSPRNMSEDELREDISRCSKSIQSITGLAPTGFRAPGYALNGRLLKILRELSFRYDSSALWSPATAWMKFLHRARTRSSFEDSYGETNASVPRGPYFPDLTDWRRPGSSGDLLEIPLPRSPFGLTPFYNNLHLSMPDLMRIIDVEFVRGDPLVYLFHLIEFCDLSDALPRTLKIHPNVSMSYALKLARMRDTVKRLISKYRIERTDVYVENFGWG